MVVITAYITCNLLFIRGIRIGLRLLLGLHFCLIVIVSFPFVFMRRGCLVVIFQGSLTRELVLKIDEINVLVARFSPCLGF